MKKIAALFFTYFVLALLSTSCGDDEPFTQMKAIENQLYLKISEYFKAQKGSDLTINLDTMVKEAQVYSYKMAYGLVDVNTDGLDEHWFTIHDHWGGSNDVSIVMRYPNDGMTYITADMIFEALTSDSVANSLLLADVSICGVGIESDTAGNAYITYLAMLVE